MCRKKVKYKREACIEYACIVYDNCPETQSSGYTEERLSLAWKRRLR